MGHHLSTSSSSAAEGTTSPAATLPKSVCPVLSEADVYTVYNGVVRPRDGTDQLSERNAMPIGLRNRPMTGQLKTLSTERIRSTIPKGGSQDTWTYPSPQMFFNGILAPKEGNVPSAYLCSVETQGQGRGCRGR